PSSRLFQEIRERRGLAYSVSSFLELQPGFGAFGAYVGTRPERVAVAVDVLGAELRKVAAGEVTAEDLGWAREHVAGRLGLSLETAGGRATLLAGRLASGLDVVAPDVLTAEIAAVDEAALHAVAAATLGNLEHAAIACVAPDAAGASAALDAAALATSAVATS
ncbi:MAG: insulinase family protein, partial [Solirubrobacteraceae bacterium]|nr:insulinase family protein [Solirubrobacteraceae bacterium]